MTIFTGSGGARSANKRHDQRGIWTRTWVYITQAQRVEWEEFLDGAKEFPFLFTLDDDITGGKERVIYLGRVVNDWKFTIVAFDVYNLTLIIEEEV